MSAVNRLVSDTRIVVIVEKDCIGKFLNRLTPKQQNSEDKEAWKNCIEFSGLKPISREDGPVRWKILIRLAAPTATSNSEDNQPSVPKIIKQIRRAARSVSGDRTFKVESKVVNNTEMTPD